MKQWEMAKLFQGDYRIRFMIGDVRDKEELLGVCINKIHDYKVNYKFNFINNFHHTNDISFIIGNKKPWGKGYSNEAVKLC